MTVRITKEIEKNVEILHVDGQLHSEDVITLNTEFRRVTGSVILDLSQLQSADKTGVAVLLEIASTGAELRGASGYVKMLLSNNG
ncbi:MAG: hypothetical protein P1V19_10395 [Gimesia sp.]|nr:hypothetical protein [Gimesia sp.]